MVDARYCRLRAASTDDVGDIASLSSQTFGERDGGGVEVVAHSVARWRETRSPVITARDDAGRFLGYAMVKPNRAGEDWRLDGQVAVLTHLAVAPEARGKGVGSALLERAVKTTRMLGWARVMAQVPVNLDNWYHERGWTVHPRGALLAWVEPWLPRDDRWYPELPTKAFSPLLFLAYRPDYPRIVTMELSSERPLMEISVPVDRGTLDVDEALGRTASAEILRHPQLVDILPPALVSMITEAPGVRRTTRASPHAQLGRLD